MLTKINCKAYVFSGCHHQQYTILFQTGLHNNQLWVMDKKLVFYFVTISSIEKSK